jgi:signal recognition particle subunit SRP54
MFESLTGKFTQAFSALRSRGKITSADIDQVADQIYQALLEADVALGVVENFVEKIKAKSLEALPALQSGSNQAQAIFEIVNAELIEILGGQARRVL